MSSATLTASAVNNAARRGNALGRRLLIISAWLVFAFFLLLPLFVVATEALKQGVGVFVASILEPDAISALKLTLLAVGIAVGVSAVLSLGARLGFPIAITSPVLTLRGSEPPRRTDWRVVSCTMR